MYVFLSFRTINFNLTCWDQIIIRPEIQLHRILKNLLYEFYRKEQLVPLWNKEDMLDNPARFCPRLHPTLLSPTPCLPLSPSIPPPVSNLLKTDMRENTQTKLEKAISKLFVSQAQNTGKGTGKPPRRFALTFCKQLSKSLLPFLYDTNGFLTE